MGAKICANLGVDMTPKDIDDLLESLFAPWVQELQLTLKSTISAANDHKLNSEPYVFSLPVTSKLRRSDADNGKSGGGVLCGQALAAASDTVSVLSLALHNKRFRECTTTDLTTRFMRPVFDDELELHVRVLSSGKRMAVTDVEAKAIGSEKVFAKGSCAFAYLSD